MTGVPGAGGRGPGAWSGVGSGGRESGAGCRGPGGRGRSGVGRMAKINHFRELQVWQRGMDIVEAVYRLSGGFPRTELYGLTSQIRRAAVSVPSNIAEGHTRESTKEYLNHISMAQASLAEVETQIEIAKRLGYLEQSDLDTILESSSILGKQLYRLRDALVERG